MQREMILVFVFSLRAKDGPGAGPIRTNSFRALEAGMPGLEYGDLIVIKQYLA